MTSREEPLLKRENSDGPATEDAEFHPLIEKTVLHRKDIVELSSRLRRESRTKWWVLICSLVISSAIFHCQYSIGALENDIMKFYDLDNTEFALLTTVVYFFAVVASFAGPTIVHRYGLYVLSLCSQVSLVVSQVFVCLSFTDQYIALLYVGRALNGISLGWNYIVANSTIGIWFNGSKWQAIAFIASQNSIECGILAARYILVPIKKAADGDLTAPFYFSLSFAICSLIASIVMYCYEEHFVLQYIIPHASRYTLSSSRSHSGDIEFGKNDPEKVADDIVPPPLDDNKNDENDDNDDATSDDVETINNIREHLHDLTSTSQQDYYITLKTFSIDIWLLIGICCVGTACVGIFDNEMEEPLQVKFGLSEWMSNFEISLTIIIGLALGGFFCNWYFKIRLLYLLDNSNICFYDNWHSCFSSLLRSYICSMGWFVDMCVW